MPANIEPMSEASIYNLHIKGAFSDDDRRRQGADHYAENLRYDYLEGKNTTSFAEGTGQRLMATRNETNPPDGVNVTK